MSDKKWTNDSRFVNSEGGITIDRSGDNSLVLIPPGSRFDDDGNLVVPEGWQLNTDGETYSMVK